MSRIILTLLMLPYCLYSTGQTGVTVADSISRRPLPNASVFDRQGKFIGTTGRTGRLPAITATEYPITIRYMGFKEHTIPAIARDTILMQENVMELPEFVVESSQCKILHILAYVREYSTLSTYTDTVSLFREKMVDYMLPVEPATGFKGWSTPRILKSQSYYRFTNALGLDSVSDRCNHHFSWADWVGIPRTAELPGRLLGNESATVTLHGKYSPTETWIKDNGLLSIDVDVLADTTSRRWVPALSMFFRNDVDFERFTVRFNYDNVSDSSLSPIDLAGYSFNIESAGRGHPMFKFNRVDEPFFVNTYAEVYLTDKEFITVKEAKKWRRLQSGDLERLAIYEPEEAPGLQQAVRLLIERVNNMNHDDARLSLTPDRNLAGRRVRKFNVGLAVLKRLKGLVGIDKVAARRKWNRQWRDFRHERRMKNKSALTDSTSVKADGGHTP